MPERCRPTRRRAVGRAVPGTALRSMIQFHSLENPQLERFLERHKAGLSLKDDVDLDLVLRQILQKAYEFVPSGSGSILLDDPFGKVASRGQNELVFIATFGDASGHS